MSYMIGEKLIGVSDSSDSSSGFKNQSMFSCSLLGVFLRGKLKNQQLFNASANDLLMIKATRWSTRSANLCITGNCWE